MLSCFPLLARNMITHSSCAILCLDPVMITNFVFVGADGRWMTMENLILEDAGT